MTAQGAGEENRVDKKRILFVDDEANVLQALQRMLRTLRDEWDIETADSGPAALARMAAASFDVIVSDMRMPGMDGAQLLAEVRQRYPQTIRIILSGQSDQESILRSVGPTHQYLSKPCSAEMLKSTVGRACAIRDILSQDTLRQLLSKIHNLPSLPSLYLEVMKELQSPDASIERVGRIIAKDPAMSAKILQLVNSAFFGFPTRITHPSRAVTILGLEKVKALVLSIHVFSEFQASQLPGFSLESLWDHSLKVANFAKLIAADVGAAPTMVDDCFSAGLLHDTGRLILAGNMTADYARMLAWAQQQKSSLELAEEEIFGATHAEVGAYLLGLWGLPHPIIEAVALHHTPRECFNLEFSPLAAVHVADALDLELKHGGEENYVSTVDTLYLQSCALLDKLPGWRTACQAETQKSGLPEFHQPEGADHE
ncbi:MAG: HDOD domain-containing protein [Candidatus Firestonebacteria bacterium]|nr:HDOD domain-containing protein [Candidatus Firestonebacteria bacterium]